MLRDTTSSRLLLGALLVAGLTLAAVDSRAESENSTLAPVRSAAATVFGPLQTSLMFVARPVTGAAQDFQGGRERTDRIAALSAENMDLAARLRQTQATAADTSAGGALANAAERIGIRVVAARVIGVDLAARSVSVNAGSADGIETNTAVLDVAGVVGRVGRVTAHTATVLLLVDPLSTVGVRSADTGQIGTLQGNGGELCRLTFFDRNAKPRVGENLVTFGSRESRPYPAGVPVGQVVSVREVPGGFEAMVRPHARYGTLDAVGIVAGVAPQSLAKAASKGVAP
ncbi:MAG: rod shape-determining protein MreC [Sporichthyaceae bacterium]